MTVGPALGPTPARARRSPIVDLIMSRVPRTNREALHMYEFILRCFIGDPNIRRHADTLLRQARAIDEHTGDDLDRTADPQATREHDAPIPR